MLSFALVFLLVAAWEFRRPRRVLTTSKKRRWICNLGLTLFNPVAVRLVFPVVAVDMALWAEGRGWGVLNTLELPFALEMILGVLAMDLVIYFQHVLFHAVPALWRLHRVHHTDLDYDLTTGLRFHPLEIFLSMALKLAAVAVIGPPVAAVLAFEVLLNGMAMFNHGNIQIPARLDCILRKFVVTPDMHRVHHSVIIKETNSNYGFNISWWDRLLGTYRDRPARGHEGMTIGLAQFRDPARLTLPWLLVLPALGDPGPQPINRH